MEFKEYYISNNKGKSNCVIRTICKLLNNDYEEIEEKLLYISKKMNCESYTEIEVFEKILNNNGYFKMNVKDEIQIKNLNLANGKYAVLCYDKNDYYHMIGIIDNVIYDKDDRCLDLYTINIYKRME